MTEALSKNVRRAIPDDELGCQGDRVRHIPGASGRGRPTMLAISSGVTTRWSDEDTSSIRPGR